MTKSWLIAIILILSFSMYWGCRTNNGGDGDGDTDVDSDSDTDADSDSDSDVFAPGAECDYQEDSAEYYCDGDTLVYCNPQTGAVTEWYCADSSATCSETTTLGHAWCVYDDMWEPGDPCDYWIDYPNNSICWAEYLYFCDTDDFVTGLDCHDSCPDGITAYCAYDNAAGYNTCFCEGESWAPGYACDYYLDYDQAICDGTNLIYCAENNIIGEVDCTEQCADWYGGGATGTCGYSGECSCYRCLCEFTGCDHEDFCIDGDLLSYCDAGTSYVASCDDWCVSQKGATAGHCTSDASGAYCQCDI